MMLEWHGRSIRVDWQPPMGCAQLAGGGCRHGAGKVSPAHRSKTRAALELQAWLCADDVSLAY